MGTCLKHITKTINRPENEKPFSLLPVGYPADHVEVPKLGRKGLEDMSVWY